MNLKEIAKVIEGVLFVSGEGVEIDVFKTRFDMNDREFNKCLDILKEKYNEKSGVNVITYKSKVQLCSNPDIVESISELLNPIRERSLTKAAMETVAIVAYKQPVTRIDIENIRGVNCDYAIQLLQANNLIEVVGRKDSVGKPLLFGTTEEFLKRFQVDSIDQLPDYNTLLESIKVLETEGVKNQVDSGSLYNNFDIPEEVDTTNEQQEEIPDFLQGEELTKVE